jgi:hypothetical protein
MRMATSNSLEIKSYISIVSFQGIVSASGFVGGLKNGVQMTQEEAEIKLKEMIASLGMSHSEAAVKGRRLYNILLSNILVCISFKIEDIFGWYS